MSWIRLAGAEGCVSTQDLARDVEARLHRSVFVSPSQADVSVEGHVAPTGAGPGWDDDKRAVFVLYEIEQLTMADVSAAIGCPLQTAYSRLHAARDLVQASIRRFHEGEEVVR